MSEIRFKNYTGYFIHLSILKLILILGFIISGQSVNGQSRFQSGLGFGLNYSKFYLEKIDIPYPDPMSFILGVNIRAMIGYEINERIELGAEFGFSYMDSKAKKINNRISYCFDVPVYATYLIRNNIGVSGGLIYQRLMKFFIGNSVDKWDLTSLSTNRNFFNPYLDITYKINSMFGIKVSGMYGLKDTYLASTADYNGIDTPPLKARRHAIVLLVYYNL